MQPLLRLLLLVVEALVAALNVLAAGVDVGRREAQVLCQDLTDQEAERLAVGVDAQREEVRAADVAGRIRLLEATAQEHTTRGGLLQQVDLSW